jgi:hypothetical protein
LFTLSTIRFNFFIKDHYLAKSDNAK